MLAEFQIRGQYELISINRLEKNIRCRPQPERRHQLDDDVNCEKDEL